ncbi:MAG: hypothetical protein IIB69_06655 [Proteobacteria bacterium]|nr:hypothetical protein [Pseudomonadota bacterium]
MRPIVNGIKFLKDKVLKAKAFSGWKIKPMSAAICSESDPDIVAYVGKQEISARDFQLNYEFGFALLKKTNDRKISHLMM